MEKELRRSTLLVSAAITALAICGLSNIALGQGTTGVAASTQGPRGEAVTPFMAEEVSENTRTLLDGNRITHKSIVKIYRDSEGRMRREEHRINPRGVQEDLPIFINIDDPIAGAFYALDPRSHTARKLARGDAIDFSSGHRTTSTPQRPSAWRGADGREYRREPLGSQVLEGFNTEGTRITEVIPAGAQGNERPLETVREVWFSRELHINLLMKVDDPFGGQTVTQTTNIRLEEPSPELFQVPPDYIIEVVPPSAPPSSAKPADNE